MSRGRTGWTPSPRTIFQSPSGKRYGTLQALIGKRGLLVLDYVCGEPKIRSISFDSPTIEESAKLTKSEASPTTQEQEKN